MLAHFALKLAETGFALGRRRWVSSFSARIVAIWSWTLLRSIHAPSAMNAPSTTDAPSRKLSTLSVKFTASLARSNSAVASPGDTWSPTTSVVPRSAFQAKNSAPEASASAISGASSAARAASRYTGSR